MTAVSVRSKAVHYIPGAEPVTLDGDARGVLLLHGFGDTPQSLRAFAHGLHAHGWTVRVPCLAGHGSSLKAFTRGRADDWLSGARAALRELQSRADSVAVIGQSMGGALATIIAAEASLDALVLLVPFTQLTPRASVIAACHRAVSIVKPYWRSRTDASILDPVARRDALGRGIATPRLVRELGVVVREARRAARHVVVPTLVIHSRGDPRISVGNAETAFTRLGAPIKRLEWVERSGHVLSVDYDREWVFARTVEWLDTYAKISGPPAV